MELLIHKAIEFAVIKHQTQVRKKTKIPYIVHPIETMYNATKVDEEDINLIVAAILHDTLEDTETSLAELKEVFNEDVAILVDEVTNEEKYNSLSWWQKKEKEIERIKYASYRAKIIKLSDILANLKSIYSDYTLLGNKVYDRFNAEKKLVLWYYRSMLSILIDLKSYSIYREAKEIYTLLAKKAPK